MNFTACDFATTTPPEAQMLIYCDPPYADTAGYSAIGAFDHTAFWDKCRTLAADGHIVVISEYQAPSDFSCVMEMPTRLNMRTVNGHESRMERLFRYGDIAPLQPRLF